MNECRNCEHETLDVGEEPCRSCVYDVAGMSGWTPPGGMATEYPDAEERHNADAQAEIDQAAAARECYESAVDELSKLHGAIDALMRDAAWHDQLAYASDATLIHPFIAAHFPVHALRIENAAMDHRGDGEGIKRRVDWTG